MKKIRWEKWIDPFETLINKDDFNDDEGYKDSYEKMLSQKQVPAIWSSSFGSVPLTEDTLPGKMFNFWICHTNFDVTKKELYIMNQTVGVESIDILTRYRFRISIAKMFDEQEIKTNLENGLCDENDSRD